MTVTVPPVQSVRVVVLNYDGGEMTLDCLRSLQATEWCGTIETVLVDNGSVDGIADRVRTEFPQVRVLEPFSNLGFAAGCNLGISATGSFDAVALINNDAVVAPGWLTPLVAALESSPDVGAASSKLVFDGVFQSIEFEVPDARPPGGGDQRRLGVRVTAARLDGQRVGDGLSTDEGFHPAEPPGLNEEVSLWSGRRGSLRLRVDGAPSTSASIRVSADRRKRLRVGSNGQMIDVIVDQTPRWFDVPLGPALDVIQNAGSNLFRGGFGGDRGFHELDRGQYDAPEEVFAWCGGAVLLRREYLDDVGLFDQRFFLYYEDTDLSWRGRLRGWRYLYVPQSVVRHRHAASSGGPSAALFQYYVGRNRLLLLIKNAPARVAVRALAVVCHQFLGLFKVHVVRAVLTLHQPRWEYLRGQVKIMSGVAALAPAMLADRRRANLKVERAAVMLWETSKEAMA